MIIGIDAREAAGKPAGKGRYVQELLRRLPGLDPQIEWRCFTREVPSSVALPANASWEVLAGRGLAWHRAASKAATACDVYFSTTSYLTPQLLKVPYVLTVFDLISFQPLAIPQRRARLIERRTLARAAKRAAGILTISEATAADLRQMLPAAGGKISVTPLAADSRFKPAEQYPAGALQNVRDRYGLPDSFILTTGTLEPRKNLERLVRAYATLPSSLRAATPLVLAGKRGWQEQGIFEAIAALPDPSQVRHLDFVPDDALAPLYAAATVFCYPSLYEGFGLPVLEAMQSATPVVTSNVSSLPEVGGSAVRYVDPLEPGQIAAGLQELLGDPAERQRLGAAGRTRAEQFSWDRTATATLETLRRVAAGNNP